ncbi:MAG TPA: efflux RND transporter periplasmic adaptor subunit [Verrucomicrobiae bacterium]
MNSAARKPKLWLLVGVAAILVIAIYLAVRPKAAQATGGFYTVKRGDFLISVVEGGTLQAVNEVAIRNEVEGTARIIYIVPEGSYVKKGDMLVELDSASAQDQVNTQLISVEKAQFALIQAEEQLAIQQSVVDSEVRAAELKLQFAQMDLEKWLKMEAEQERTKAENEITTIREKLAIEKEKAEWSEKLEKQGFETKANRDRDMLTVKQTELSFQMSTNALAMLKEFDLKKKQRTYESAVHEAEEELKRVKHQGTRKLAQFEADVKTQKITLDLSKSKLARDQKNLAAAKIYAPQDGLVVYSVSENRFSSESLIEEGATVRNRQTFIKLPDISEMKLTVKIHESHINMISHGQPAYIVLDSMPDQRFRGYVSKVGLLPDTTSRWGNPNLKVYATEIMVTDKLPDVKPGVSARAEVIITNLQNVISVPLQAVTTRRGKPVVYVVDGDDSNPVDVQVGLYNTKFIEITSGLKEGDRILLAPPFDAQQKDLGGAIVGEGEEMPLTNHVDEVKALAPRLSPDGGNDRPNPPLDGPGDSGERPRFNRGENGENGANGETRPPGSQTGARGQRPNFDELRKQFDKNGDGELDETERAAMRESFGGGQSSAGRSRRGTGSGEGLQGGGSREESGGGERPRRSREPRPDSGGESAPQRDRSTPPAE